MLVFLLLLSLFDKTQLDGCLFCREQRYHGIKLSEKKSVSVVQPNPTIIFLILSSFGFVQGKVSRSVVP